ncbi:undecaprenyldiphospho-muramoylpentapeptide beta-N-acetylglucosaminyltransferase [Desulfolithobacter sp.]
MRIIVTGGGTGGHLFPGIAVATAMQERIPGCRVLFIGTERQLDQTTLGGCDFERSTISCMGLKGVGIGHRMQSLAVLPKAVWQAGRILSRFRPDLALGVGGYVTGPVLLAAKLGLAGKRIPVCIHEQNSVPGLANRILSRIADRIFLSIPCDYPFPAARTMVTGNPIRAEILHVAARKRVWSEPPVILVLGGSQGAHRLNMVMLEAAPELKKRLAGDFMVIHQTGSRDQDRVRAGYSALGIRAEVKDFFQDMASLYSRASLVVSRAGATTLAELAVVGLPALLVPYPHAADNHQEINANYYARKGGAVVFPERELSATVIADQVAGLLQAPEKLHTMADYMKKTGRPDATLCIVEECLCLVSARSD